MKTVVYLSKEGIHVRTLYISATRSTVGAGEAHLSNSSVCSRETKRSCRLPASLQHRSTDWSLDHPSEYNVKCE